MDDLVELELARYDENSKEYIWAIFEAKPYIMSGDVDGYKKMLKSKREKNTDKCQHCGCIYVVYIDSEAAIVCTECATNQKYGGNSIQVMIANAKFSGHNTVYSPHFYERKSHFIHIIHELTGYCNTKIPPEVYEVVQKGEMTLSGARISLRKAKLSQHICSVPRILEDMKKHRCAIISRTEIDDLVRDFKIVCWAWDCVRPQVAPSRKSFISYPFVLKKLCKRRGLEHLCRDAKKVKTVQANVKLEVYWRAIINKLKWKE